MRASATRLAASKYAVVIVNGPTPVPIGGTYTYCFAKLKLSATHAASFIFAARVASAAGSAFAALMADCTSSIRFPGTPGYAPTATGGGASMELWLPTRRSQNECSELLQGAAQSSTRLPPASPNSRSLLTPVAA